MLHSANLLFAASQFEKDVLPMQMSGEMGGTCASQKAWKRNVAIAMREKGGILGVRRKDLNEGDVEMLYCSG